MITQTDIKRHLLAESQIARLNDVESMGIALAINDTEGILYHYIYVQKRIADMERLKKSSVVTKKILIEHLIAKGTVKTAKEAEDFIQQALAK